MIQGMVGLYRVNDDYAKVRRMSIAPAVRRQVRLRFGAHPHEPTTQMSPFLVLARRAWRVDYLTTSSTTRARRASVASSSALVRFPLHSPSAITTNPHAPYLAT